MNASDVEAGYVVRMPKAYPVYDDAYQRNVEVLRAWLEENAPNVHPVGRNGMHRYNNQDHSMYTAMLTVENIVKGTDHDIWAVNVEDEYHEEGPVQDEPPDALAPGATPRSCPASADRRRRPVLPAAARQRPAARTGRRGRARPQPRAAAGTGARSVPASGAVGACPRQRAQAHTTPTAAQIASVG